MKTKKFERNRQLAYKRCNDIADSRQLTQGIYVPHLYDGTKKLAYWDDFGFKLGKQWVSTAWTHPRLNLNDHIEDIAHIMAEKISPFKSGAMLSNLTPNYRKLGRSRKKIISKTWNLSDNDEYFENYNRIRLELLQGKHGMDFHVPTTKFKVKQQSYGKFVDITTPVELLDDTDIIQYANQVKAHLKGEINLLEGHPEVYTLTDYHHDLQSVGEEIT